MDGGTRLAPAPLGVGAGPAITRIITRTTKRSTRIAAERVAGPRGQSDPRRPPLPTPVEGRAARRRPAAGPEPPLSTEEARALIGAVSPRTAAGARNRALLAMMYRSGLRPEEVVALAPGDVDTAGGTVAVRAGPRSASGRTTGVDATTLALVAAWVDARRARGLGRKAPLFSTLAGAPLTGAYLRQLTSRLARRAGVRARAHPMGLRRANAAELSDEGVPEAVIDRHLGLAHAGPAPADPATLERAAVRAIARRAWEVPPG
jgi:integrase